MESIGERLEEARKRKGISLREAAEATKIRSDFLGNIEQNRFDFELPDIYKRGFLQNYARFLKLDTEKILNDYNAMRLGHSRQERKGGSEWFGHLEAPAAASREETSAPSEEPGEAAGDSGRQSYGRLGGGRGPVDQDTFDTEEEPEPEEHEAPPGGDKMFYIKVGVVFVGAIALVVVIFALVRAIIGGSAEPAGETAGGGTPELRESADTDAPDAASGGNGDGAATGGTDGTDASADTLTLRATGNVYVVVRQREDDQYLLRETLSEGDSVPIDKSGPVDILFTAGENLIIEHAGERLRPSTSGTAKISLP